MTSNEQRTIEGLANLCYDLGNVCADPYISLLVNMRTTRDVSGADGPIYSLASVLQDMHEDLGWSKLEFVSAVMSALASAVNNTEFAGYNYSDDDFASVGYTQEVHLRQLCKPLIEELDDTGIDACAEYPAGYTKR